MQTQSVHQSYCSVCGKPWSLMLPISKPVFTHITQKGTKLYCNAADGTKRSREMPSILKGRG